MLGKVGLTLISATIGLLNLPALLGLPLEPCIAAPQAQEKGFTQIKLQLRPVGEGSLRTDKSQFKSGEDVEVQVLATNFGSKPVFMIHSGWFVNYLPQLWKSGELVPYSKAMEKRLTETRQMEKNLANPNAIVRDSSIVVKLPANEQRQAWLIRLSSFYDKLEQGVYELRVKYRQPNGPVIESDLVMFEVVQ